MANEFQSKGTVLTVGTEVKEKTNGGTYVVCTVKHLDGPLAGRTYFAQRTLKNQNGDEKSNVAVGDEVQLYSEVSPDGKTIFTSISKGNNVDDISELLALANAGKAAEIAEQAMS